METMEGSEDKQKNQKHIKKICGLKRLFLFVKRKIRACWSGNWKKRVQYFRQLWGEKASFSDLDLNENSLFEQNKTLLCQCKANYERDRLDGLLEANKAEIDLIGETSVGESGIREIELGVLEWFKQKWLMDENEEKVQFYLWLEADYLEHLRQFVYSKRAHFQNENRQNRYEAGTASGRSIIAVAASGSTFLLGANAERVWNAIQNHQLWAGKFRWLILGAAVALMVVLVLLLYHGYKMLFQAAYTRKDNQLRQLKETWVRHVEAIATYQKEMLAYIWNLDAYQECTDQNERDCLLMQEIMAAWRKDNEIFQKNMSKDRDET